jgi:hypothetical protein
MVHLHFAFCDDSRLDFCVLFPDHDPRASLYMQHPRR